MNNDQILDMITSPSSWEQVIYDIVAFEGLDPWDLDLKKLTEGFVSFVNGMKEMDFKIPAKYIMVAAVLLRMKSDHLPLLDYFQEEPDADLEENGGTAIEAIEDPVINLLTIPPRRISTRRVVVSELVDALRKALGTQQRRDVRQQKSSVRIQLRKDDIGKRITRLYDRINALLTLVKNEEVPFRSVVDEWTRPEVVETFMPLVFLDHEKKVETRQENIFEEIYIKRGSGKEEPPAQLTRRPRAKTHKKRGKRR